MNSLAPLLHSTAENVFLYGFMFLFTLAVVITIHEFGHYLAARFFKVRVEQFAFGFGKELFGIGGKNNKTRWSFCLLPLGGYVKIFGDVDVNNPQVWDHENNCARTLTPEELDVSYCTKPVWQRAIIVSAGPAINIALTLAIFLCLFTTIGQKSSFPVINGISIGSNAQKAGIEIGDKIIAVDGKKLRRLDDIYDKTWYEDPPVPYTYTIIRDDQEIDITFAAKRVSYTTSKGIQTNHGQTGMIQLGAVELKSIVSVNDIPTDGDPDKAREIISRNFDQMIKINAPYKDDKDEISKKSEFLVVFYEINNDHFNDPSHKHYDLVYAQDPDNFFYLRLGPLEALSRAAFIMKESIVNTYKLISVVYKGKTKEPLLGGVGKISAKTAKAAEAGFYDYMIFLAIFSYMIAIINLLPIPVFDGGHLVFLAYEAIRGRPLSPRFQSITMIIGLVFLLGIMIIANVSDLISLINK